ncbi:MAG: hypothetical protein HC797_06955, partial [Anaerolineales bacterium]|nr:hypothetical protein [Anaerolineales bacterium]
MRDVETIFHFASAENQGARGDLSIADIQGTQNLVDAATDAGVDRIVYLSHLGARAHQVILLSKPKALPKKVSVMEKYLIRLSAHR